jgi:hypothetical protein
MESIRVALSRHLSWVIGPTTVPVYTKLSMDATELYAFEVNFVIGQNRYSRSFEFRLKDPIPQTFAQVDYLGTCVKATVEHVQQLNQQSSQ